MKTETKEIDAMEAKQRAQEQLAREIEGMTREQELEFYARAPLSEDLARVVERIRANEQKRQHRAA